MRLSRHHLIAWLAFAAVAATIAAYGCYNYNQFAGTDKTPLHRAAIAVAVLAGPLVGPFANDGSLGGTPGVLMWTVLLLLGLSASLTPFVFVKRPVSHIVHLLAWCGYLAACLAWYGSAIISLGIFLS